MTDETLLYALQPLEQSQLVRYGSMLSIKSAAGPAWLLRG
jgi:hypothetical protein